MEERLSGAQQGHLFAADVVEELCTALIAEMDKPKVWDGAPSWVTDARVRWTDRNGVSGHNDMYSPLYTRTLPKSRIDEIAEEATSAYMKEWGTPSDGFLAHKLPEIIKSAILKDREEREAER